MYDCTLEQHLETWAGNDEQRIAAMATINALTTACRDIARIIAAGALAGNMASRHKNGTGGDFQTALDVEANTRLIEALRRAPVAAIASEEMDEPLAVTAGAPILVALDPLDGSSNIETNVSIGTIFSLLPSPPVGSGTEPAAFLRAGREQIAAGYVIYGPQIALALTLGAGTDIFTLDPATGHFVRTAAGLRVPTHASEFAINASNYRHWDAPIGRWFDDCLSGAEGPRGVNFNMRWIASLVAEAHRILVRGGIYVYPADSRPGYNNGRLRLLYEANPIAFLIEQAGGYASTGREPILDRVPHLLHERVPLVFGARDEVARVERYHHAARPQGADSPLFARRGLFVSNNHR